MKGSGCLTGRWEKSHRCQDLGPPANQACLPPSRGLPHTQSFQPIGVRQTQDREAGSPRREEKGGTEEKELKKPQRKSSHPWRNQKAVMYPWEKKAFPKKIRKNP